MEIKRDIYQIVIKKTVVLFCLFVLVVTAAEASRALKASKKTHPEYKVALVVGNSDYTSSPLKNPVNDATDMANKLKSLGFSVKKLLNANQEQMEKAIDQFGNDLKRGGVGLFFYAGHGMQVKGVNYLIPVGKEIDEEGDVKFRAVDAGLVLAKMGRAGNRLNMVFLDACRNNPFARSFRSSARGLAQMDAPAGSMIAYATAPGETAADGQGRNGVFTKNLLRGLDQNGDLELLQFMKMVQKGVQTDTRKKQIPWVATSVTGDFYFGNGGAGHQIKTVSSKESLSESPPENILFEGMGMTFVYIKPGTFIMGSPSNESGRKSDETLHQVTLTRGYYLQTTEVTYRLWSWVMGGNPSNCDHCPVVNVDWYDVQRFIKELNRKEGHNRYRLPTEAEWEYACRAGSKSPYANSNSLDTMGWYYANSGGHIHAVAQKQPNAWGLYDMHGNVWEWCQDWKNDYPSGVVTDPATYSASFFGRPVNRGGSFLSLEKDCRSASRDGSLPGTESYDLGFRLALSPDELKTQIKIDNP